MKNIYKKLLEQREKKYQKIQFLKETYNTVISVKTNLPGVDKQKKIAYVLVNHFCNLIDTNKYIEKIHCDGYDGPYYLLGSNCSALILKDEFTRLEENNILGRFIDIDVFDGKTNLSRGFMRKCYLCDDYAFACRKANKHTTFELVSYVESNVVSYFLAKSIDIVDCSIMLELNLHPKFGLITPFSNGSHSDMNYDLMIKAKDSIIPHLKNMFIIGWSTKPLNLIFDEIRKIGLQAERDMLLETNNVNAYKGLIFNLGILVTAYAYCKYNSINLVNLKNVLIEMSKSVIQDFVKPTDTFGYLAYKNFGILGARGEVSKGLPNVFGALSYLKDFSDESRIRTLMYLISVSEDTVLLKRSNDFERYTFYKNLFKSKLSATSEEINELDTYCQELKLSFGGSADLLVLTIFLKKILS
ncbi:MAG: triphosphoribosyl-dephospho-CoA synthase [Tenericutes bacterium]|nr:triphosphoribosyl-dephospho-CoA synthase [Mycoplasmatota bacterium]